MKLKFPKTPKQTRSVYLDNAATTQIDPMVKKAMEPFLNEKYGNAGGLYKLGRISNLAIKESRSRVADILGTVPENIIFTGSGTESVNMAILGVARASQKHGRHIITSKIEHKAVLKSVEHLKKEGFNITYLGVDSEGMVNLQELERAICKQTVLVSIMYANNEVGTVQPLAKIGKIILKKRKDNQTEFPLFHTDACQAAGALQLKVDNLHVDLMSMNGSKIYGPKGVGALYKRKSVEIEPIMFGGGQEFGARPGTENASAIVGFAEALKIANRNKAKGNKRLIKLRNYFWQKIKMEIGEVELNGGRLLNEKTRLPNNLNVCFKGIEGEALLLYLDEYGIMCSTGSACTSMALKPSHVLVACGTSLRDIHGSIRFSLGKKTSKADIDYVMRYLPKLVANLRSISSVST